MSLRPVYCDKKLEFSLLFHNKSTFYTFAVSLELNKIIILFSYSIDALFTLIRDSSATLEE